MAECQLPKLDVAGSNPVGRSNCTGPYGTLRKALRLSGHQMVTIALAAGGDHRPCSASHRLAADPSWRVRFGMNFE